MSQSDSEISAWLTLTRQVAQQLDEKSNVIETFWSANVRSDGRVFTETRPYTVTHSVVPSAAGSALVQVEGTVVLAAVTIAVGQSVAASGDCVVQVVDSSIASSSATSPSELQSFLQRLLDENLEFEQLSIASTTGAWAFRLQVQVHILDSDGACYDVAVAAVSAALLDTSIPVSFDCAIRTVSRETHPLHLPRVPCTLSAVGWTSTEQKDHSIVDPTHTEEEAGGRLLSLVTVDARQPDSLLAIQGPVQLPLIDYASGHARKLYAILQPSPQKEGKE